MEYSDFFGNVWSLDVNKSGTAMISVSADNSIRIYELTKEQVIPDWEKEKKLDRIIEVEMQKDLDTNKGNMNPLNKEIDKIVPIKKSLDNIGYAEDLMDSLEIAEKFKNEVYQYEIAFDEYKVKNNFK
jgi:WD40 repeat protein